MAIPNAWFASLGAEVNNTKSYAQATLSSSGVKCFRHVSLENQFITTNLITQELPFTGAVKKLSLDKSGYLAIKITLKDSLTGNDAVLPITDYERLPISFFIGQTFECKSARNGPDFGLKSYVLAQN